MHTDTDKVFFKELPISKKCLQFKYIKIKEFKIYLVFRTIKLESITIIGNVSFLIFAKIYNIIFAI